MKHPSVLIAGYPYVRGNYLNTFRNSLKKNDVLFLLPDLWKVKKGKVVYRPPKDTNIFTTPTYFHHSDYPILGGLLKGWMPFFPVVLYRLKRRYKIKVVFSPLEPVLLSTLYQGFWACIMGVKHIIFTWENISYQDKFHGLNKIIKNLIIQLNLMLADGVICGNRRASDIHQALTDKPIETIPLSGVDTGFFHRGARIGNFNGKDLSGKTVFAFAGAIGRHKGVFSIIEAMNELRKKIPECMLILAGSGEDERELDDRIQKLDIRDVVIQVPWVNHDTLKTVLSAADIFLYPSRSGEGWEEQFGYSMAEASSMELPIISTRSGSIGEVVSDGTTGILIPADDTGALIEAMLRLAGDVEGRLSMGRAGRQFIVNNYSYATVEKKFISFFRKFDGTILS